MKKSLLTIAAAVLVFAPAFAQDSSDDFDALAGGSDDTSAATDVPGALAPRTWTWSGDQQFAARWGDENDLSHAVGSVEGGMAGSFAVGDWKEVLAGRVKYNEFVPGETLVRWSPGVFKFSAGLTEFSWGVADGNNPTDTLNSRDYRHVVAQRLVNPALTAAWYPAEWVSVEAVYEPWKVASEFPTDFAAKLRTQLADFSTKVTATDVLSDGSQTVYGGRVNLFLPGTDISLSYVADRDAYFTPVITLASAAPGFAPWVPESIDLVRKTVQRVGVNAKTTVDRFGLWFEGAYNITEDPAATDLIIRDNKLSWTTGLDFNFGPSSAYYLNVQYAGTWVPGFDAANHPFPGTTALNDKAVATKYFNQILVDSVGAETEEWLHGGSYSLKFPLADALVTPSLNGAFLVPVGYNRIDAAGDSRGRLLSAYFQPEIDLVPFDGIHVLWGAELAYGWIQKKGEAVSLDTATDKLGTYTPQNNVYLKVVYQWNASESRP